MTRQPDDRADHDDILVELTRVPIIAEAIAIRQNLERAGIAATVFESDAGGWAPHYAIGLGHRVMVHASDLGEARGMLSDTGGLLPLETPRSEVHKHRRPHRPDDGK